MRHTVEFFDNAALWDESRIAEARAGSIPKSEGKAVHVNAPRDGRR